MSQDTRKDPRAKIVSLNVRYKSATVDEFIENHSHDVSRGGLFIKTSTPFAQGTLLKFEIRLSSDQPVIAGVGRVVWKREPGQSATDRPAGMGVKFIKIDDRSRALIERLVTTKEGAGSAFNTPDDEVTRVTPNATGTPRAIELPSLSPTVSGMPGVSRPVESAPPRAPSMPAAREAAAFFPVTDSEGDMPPPQERTMMRQAAELLEEALKASGGSMAEVEQNPLFAELVMQPPTPEVAHASQEESVATIGGFPTSSPGGASLAVADVPASPDHTTPMVETPAHRSASASANAERRSAPPRSDTPRASIPTARPVRATEMLTETVPKSGGGALWAGLAVLILGGGGAYAYQSGLLDDLLGKKAPAPAPTATQPLVAPPPATATAALAAATDAAPAPSSSAAASAASSANAPAPQASASASASANAPAPPASGAAIVASATPPASAEPVATKPVEPKPVVAKPAPKPVIKPAEPTEPKPVEAKPTTTDGDPAPAPPPKKKPAPKPKDDSDNPY